MAVILYLLIGILSIILLTLIDYIRNFQFYKDGDKIPGPKSLPIVGNAFTFIGMDSNTAYEKLKYYAGRYPSPFRTWVGNLLCIAIFEADQIKTVLTSPKSMEKASLYRFLRPWLGNSLILAPVSLWRPHRKLIQPAFNPQTLRTFVQIFDKHSKSMVKQMEAELDGDEFEIRSYVIPFSFNVALEGTMGITEAFDSETYAHYVQCVNRSFDLAVKRSFRPWLYPDKIYNLTKASKEFYKSVAGMHRISHAIIAKKRTELENPDEVKKDEIVNQRRGFLDILLELQGKQKFTDQETCDEVNLMIMAAFDTVSVSLQYILLMLACYPDVQERAYQELKHIYGEVIPENVCVTSEDLKEMKYIERVIQESMRLFPTIAFVLRKVEEDLEVGGYTLPKGCTVFCSIMKVHRDEKYWPDPFKFDPDRFLPEEVAKRNPYCYLPFSGGPRNCIGHLYAMMQMKTAVARILIKFVLKKKVVPPMSGIKQRIEVVSHPLKPLKIHIVKRLPDI